MRLAVVGTGLMGASVGLAAKRAGVDHVTGYDADPESARMVTFGGQEGWLGAKHADDLTPLWRAGRYVPMRLASLPARGRDLRLVPA